MGRGDCWGVTTEAVKDKIDWIHGLDDSPIDEPREIIVKKFDEASRTEEILFTLDWDEERERQAREQEQAEHERNIGDSEKYYEKDIKDRRIAEKYLAEQLSKVHDELSAGSVSDERRKELEVIIAYLVKKIDSEHMRIKGDEDRLRRLT